MQEGSPKLSALAGRVLSWAQMKGCVCASSAVIGQELRLGERQLRKLLDRMNRSGLIIQLSRGLYLLPEKLPPGGRWQPPAEVAVWYFMRAKGATWQETGPAAFNFHGLTGQVANVTTVYNDKISGRRRFGKLEVVFIKVSASRLGNVVEREIGSEKRERRLVGTLARVVFDAVYDYNIFGTLPMAYGWILGRTSDNEFLQELPDCALRYGNVASRRRIGWLLERTGAPEKIWRPLQKSLTRSSAFIPVDPNKPGRGRTNKTWGVVENFEPKMANDR